MTIVTLNAGIAGAKSVLGVDIWQPVPVLILWTMNYLQKPYIRQHRMCTNGFVRWNIVPSHRIIRFCGQQMRAII